MRHFQQEDFEEYRSWYSDPILNRELGPMDDQWLEHVLNENPPKQFSFFEDNNLIAVIGTERPQSDKSAWFITDIAVDPEKRRSGVATNALQLLIEEHRQLASPPGSWIAWVGASNQAALDFFHRLGWNRSEQPNVENMFQLYLETNSCSKQRS